MLSSPGLDSPDMRRRHTGSVTLRSDGRWQVYVSLPNGHRRYAYLPRGASEDAAQAKLDELSAAVAARTGDLDPTSPLGRYLARWMDDVAASLRPSTQRHYRMIMERHLVPALGRIPLGRLTPGDVQGYLADAALRVSPQTVRHHRAVLRRALNIAMRWGLVNRNVAALTEPPRVERDEPATLSPLQVRRFLAQVKDDRLHALYVLAVTTGMRQGELLGLAWSNVDRDRGVLSVSRTLIRHQGEYRFAEPKTARSRRTIHLTSSAAQALRAHWSAQMQERIAAGRPMADGDDGLVFVTRSGRPINGRELLRWFHAHLDAAGLPRIRWHDLRHTTATLLLSQGYTLEDVKQLLGHSTITLTSNTYGHIVERRSRELADGMETLLRDAN
jgi:integrase